LCWCFNQSETKAKPIIIATCKCNFHAQWREGREGVLPFMGYIGMFRGKGYGF